MVKREFGQEMYGPISSHKIIIMFNFRKQKRAYEYQTRNLILELESGWIEYKTEKNYIDSPLTFIKDKTGVGALQISLASATNGNSFDISETLKRRKKGYIKDFNQYKLRDWTVYEYEEANNKMHISHFNFTKLNVIVYATYTCNLEYLDKKELKEAIKIIKSIEVTSKN